jgi:hypothetical protein
MELECVDWIHPTQSSVQQQALLYMKINTVIPYKTMNFLKSTVSDDVFYERLTFTELDSYTKTKK